MAKLFYLSKNIFKLIFKSSTNNIGTKQCVQTSKIIENTKTQKQYFTTNECTKGEDSCANLCETLDDRIDPIKNKVALIIGGAEGLGLHYAKELLRCGVKALMITDLDEARGRVVICNLTCEFGCNRASFIKADATNLAHLENAFHCCLGTWNGLDIVINNAQIVGEMNWKKTLDVNCLGVTYGTLLGLEFMGKHRGCAGGTIINTSSMLAFYKPGGCPVFVGTNFYTMGISSSFGNENNFVRTGVRVMTLCPSITESMIADLVCKSRDNASSKLMNEELCYFPTQSPDNATKSLISMLLRGESGSIWISEGSDSNYKADVPDKNSLQRDVVR